MKEFSYGAIESATNGFALENLIGKGSHGVVYRGHLDNGTPVAVKKPSPLLPPRATQDPEEIAILASTTDCPASSTSSAPAATPPATHAERLAPRRPPLALRRPSWRGAWNRAPASPRRRVAHGASPPVVHRDVKSENVLFDAAWDARLADFSLAVRVGGGGRTEPIGLPPAGTIGYLDPSYTESKLLSPKNDVFSFGVLLLELVSSRKVMDVDSDTCSIVAWAVPMIRARRYDEVVDRRVGLSAGTERSAVVRILRVAARCAAEKAEERPGMGEVVRELEGVVDECVSWWWARHGINWCSIVRNYRVWRRRRRRRVGTRRIVCKDHLAGGGGGGKFDLDLEFRKNHS
ncbi:Serine/threonine-protein kinase-like protein [Ananas comosus]|uniref:Serine/threonine-protein kinase-like protein n=1 Tax=Ananas comosus TaxID=4615 RepID=A0A199UP69_ANACO|nr:Serine/threonine-protein kinase-like protein [Ananas comosus]